jgi:hypothetical protein
MTQSPPPTQADVEPAVEILTPQATTTPQPSYVKLAMRNMVRKRGLSLFHFSLTTIALLGVLISLACIDHYFHP